METSTISSPESTSSNAEQPMLNPPNNQKTLVVIGVMIIFAVLTALAYFVSVGSPKQSAEPPILTQPTPTISVAESPVACTLDARICPDGSAVGRVGPDCEFAPCPSEESFIQAPEGWEGHAIPDAKLTFAAPADLIFYTETQRHIDTGAAYSLTMYVQRETGNSPDYYQLYGLYQWGEAYATKDIAQFKGDLQPGSIEETTISGYPALKGQVKGERNRFVTYIFTDIGKFSLFTAEPTSVNKALTDSILATFVFAK